MGYVGYLHKMETQKEDPVIYHLTLGDERVKLNQYLGQEVKLDFLQDIACIHCGRKISKTFNSGYCYPCFTRLPENDICIVKPFLCKAEQGTCRDPEFSRGHCLIPHYVYLALSSGIKVGVTRKIHHLERWMDQGAIRAIPIAEVPNRRIAGDLELHLSQYMPDKTNWRKMLKGELEGETDLLKMREKAFSYFPEDFAAYAVNKETWVEITYPVLEVPEKIKAYDLNKQSSIQDKLIGIKGQYLIFSQGVLNVRKFSGYKVEWQA